MEPPKGFWATLWRFLRFLPFFLGLLLLGIIKGALLCPLVCLIMTIGNSAIILGLWPAHAVWTYYCIARTKQLGPVLKLVLGTGISVILVLWPLAGISGSILLGAGYGFLAPVMATFDAVGEGKTNEFIHCFVDGTWSTIKGCFTVVRDLKDVCFHSYFSIMDDLRLHDPPDGKPYEIRLHSIPGSFLVGLLGIMIDVPVITIIAICKSPYMLIKGWNRLFHDLVGREGPFLETACVPFAGLAILLWPLAVAGAVAASIMSSFPLGAYAAVVAYQESSIHMGLCYIIASLSMFDEYSNDILDLPEGSWFPRPQYRKKELLHASSFSRPTSSRREKQEGKSPPSRATSFKNSIRELKPFKLLEHLFSECKRYGDNLVSEGVITLEDIEEARSGKGGSRTVSIGLPAYSILQALLESAKANTDGLVLSDNTLITIDNRPKDRFFDWFFDPLMIIKEQIKAEKFSEEEENYLSKLVLLLGDSKRLKNLNAQSPQLNERRRAEINAFARRLQGITKSISRYPTAKRRFDDLVKSLSEELEKKMRGSQSVNGSPQTQRSRSGATRLFSQKSTGKKASIQGDNQGA
ncbi:uncharacterized membrane protein At3g27390-like [Phoenix dactylifera]|uniref:Uncharacterized membrane protein At3g27390-like n=1 Tax=Phoenix dactylifera TaxID=42345 RepID=A0A8B7CC67_PHODC|nr:uncharacterized membrane protein At3g27390-like [Phoenix dactylifera]